MAVVWISLPGLPPNFFAKRSLLSIALAVGKPLAVDKATQQRTRPSAARVKVIIDLLDKHPKQVKLQIVDRATGKYVVHYQEIVYDNLPKYCNCCKHQGHDKNVCRVMKVQAETEGTTERVHMNSDLPVMEGTNVEKLQGDARDYLNAIRAGQTGKDLPNKDDKQGLDTAKENDVNQQVLQFEGGKQSVSLSNQNVNNPGFKEITVDDVAKLDKGPTKPS